VVANEVGIPITPLVAAGLLLIGCASLLRRPVLGLTGTPDREIVTPWPEPALAMHSGSGDGPVLVG
jgi:hypothetical protein